ncbi:ABC transporter permease [Advenella sp. WQ 585]|uniref:Cell division protein FtsX n=1 Tax=Advenella mandrilli TaxID=2800330 RepID=A0ABS1EAD0_9BURK|nr:ABC transporter permease [Advenella mandrilli]MBK1780784.1 ABC transporter permease [Advenella mandrilli]
MNTWLRHHLYAIHIAARRLLGTPFSSLTNIMVIALVLTLPLLASAILVSMEPLARNISVNPAISLFMNDTTTIERTRELAKQLQDEHSQSILTLEVIDKAQALQSLKASESWSDALKVLPQNPLPHSIIITLSDEASPTEMAEQLAQAWSQLPEVDVLQFDSAWIQKLEAILSFIRIVLGLLAAGVALIVITTIFNTVRMQALVQRDEIAVARLVGATESFVRRPFLYFGALTGLTAGLLAVLLSTLTLSVLNQAITLLSSSYGIPFSFTLPPASWLALTIALVMIIAATAARWSVTRHSHF